MTTLYVLNLKTESGLAFYQHLTGLKINIIEMNHQNNIAKEITNDMPVVYEPRVRTKECRIGSTTFIVSSKFNSGEPCDIVSKIARLIQHDNENAPYIYG